MQERFQYSKAYPEAYKAMLALSQAVEKTGLTPQLIDLVNYRVSQLNSCAFCLDMHSKDLRARGETEQRLYMISAWREAPHLYSDRERAALAWAEAVTRLEDGRVSDEVYEIARQELARPNWCNSPWRLSLSMVGTVLMWRSARQLGTISRR